jgi:hypothetical protein
MRNAKFAILALLILVCLGSIGCSTNLPLYGKIVGQDGVGIPESLVSVYVITEELTPKKNSETTPEAVGYSTKFQYRMVSNILTDQDGFFRIEELNSKEAYNVVFSKKIYGKEILRNLDPFKDNIEVEYSFKGVKSKEGVKPMAIVVKKVGGIKGKLLRDFIDIEAENLDNGIVSANIKAAVKGISFSDNASSVYEKLGKEWKIYDGTMEYTIIREGKMLKIKDIADIPIKPSEPIRDAKIVLKMGNSDNTKELSGVTNLNGDFYIVGAPEDGNYWLELSLVDWGGQLPKEGNYQLKVGEIMDLGSITVNTSRDVSLVREYFVANKSNVIEQIRQKKLPNSIREMIKKFFKSELSSEAEIVEVNDVSSDVTDMWLIKDSTMNYELKNYKGGNLKLGYSEISSPSTGGGRHPTAD